MTEPISTLPPSVPVSVTAGDIARIIRRELGAQLDAIDHRLSALEEQVHAIHEILASSKDIPTKSAKMR